MTTKKALTCAVMLLVTLACASLPGPLLRATPTVRPTRTHRPTRTPTPTETFTPPPTPSPLPPPTLLPITLPPPPSAVPSPTLPLASPTSTKRPPGELDCTLIWQSPGFGATYSRGEHFGAGWNLRNSGTVTWDPGTFRFVYLGGRKLSNTDQVSLRTSVAPGQTIIISVPMKAPEIADIYTTHWGLRTGDTYFCKLTVTIIAN